MNEGLLEAPAHGKDTYMTTDYVVTTTKGFQSMRNLRARESIKSRTQKIGVLGGWAPKGEGGVVRWRTKTTEPWRPPHTTARFKSVQASIYFGARNLDPKLGRWLSEDPALLEYLPVPEINDDAKKHNGQLPGMGGVFNSMNLNLWHYGGNNPIKYRDPDGRDMHEFLDEITEGDSSKGYNGSTQSQYVWKDKVFVFGISGSATAPLISVGGTYGVYFVPRDPDDEIFLAAFAAYSLLTIDDPNGVGALTAFILAASRSKEVGIMKEGSGINVGSGTPNVLEFATANENLQNAWKNGLSAGAGFTVGVYKSVEDLLGQYSEAGGSINAPIFNILNVGVGYDVVLNSKYLVIGHTLTVGVGVGAIWEIHSRWGSTQLERTIIE